MSNRLFLFENCVRLAHRFSDVEEFRADETHPFEQRNVYDGLPETVKRLFDNAHYAQSTFEAFKFLEKEIQRHSGLSKSGFNLMMDALDERSAKIRLSPLSNTSEKDEQMGYKFLFSGGISGIRNPRGHEYTIRDDIDTCLDHLSFISMLFRRLLEAGYR